MLLAASGSAKQSEALARIHDGQEIRAPLLARPGSIG
jgi:hypothetical protein